MTTARRTSSRIRNKKPKDISSTPKNPTKKIHNNTKTSNASSPTLKQSAWMHPTLRAWLISLRPWSFPASIGPIALTGALLHRPLSTTTYLTPTTVTPIPNLLCLSFVLCFIVVLSLHASANLFNTYYDFINGNDTKDTADDRGLVDGTVSPNNVFYSAVSSLIVGGSAAIYLTMTCPALLYVVVLPAIVLCVLYTANPFSLKKYALGDVTIFLMFGPLLMIGVSVAVTAAAAAATTTTDLDTVSDLAFSIRHDVLLYSIPMGLATVGILHANNARDVVADEAAGLNTLAMKFGTKGSYYFHCLLMALTYGLIVLYIFTPIVTNDTEGIVSGDGAAITDDTTTAAAVDQMNILNYLPTAMLTSNYTTLRQLIVMLNVPWCLYVSRSFADSKMKELPQKIAQHNLLYTTLLVMSLCEPMFLGRVLLTCLFYLGGVNNIIMWSYNIHLVDMKLNNIFCNSVPKVVSQILVSFFSIFVVFFSSRPTFFFFFQLIISFFFSSSVSSSSLLVFWCFHFSISRIVAVHV